MCLCLCVHGYSRAPHTPPHPHYPTTATPSVPQSFSVLLREGISVQMMSQGASKVNISLVIDAHEGQRAVKALHAEFFGKR